MAHRKNPNALRRRRNLSNPVFCVYTRKDYTIKSWTNRLKRLQRAKLFGQKAKQLSGLRPGAGQLKNKNSPNKTNNKKELQKQTHAVAYSSHFSNSIYTQYSKPVFFKNSKIQKKKQSKLNRLSNRSLLLRHAWAQPRLPRAQSSAKKYMQNIHSYSYFFYYIILYYIIGSCGVLLSSSLGVS